MNEAAITISVRDIPEVSKALDLSLQAIVGLLAALKKSAETVIAYDLAIKSCADDPAKMATFCTAQGEDLDALYFAMTYAAREAEALASATGKAA